MIFLEAQLGLNKKDIKVYGAPFGKLLGNTLDLLGVYPELWNNFTTQIPFEKVLHNWYTRISNYLLEKKNLFSVKQLRRYIQYYLKGKNKIPRTTGINIKLNM